MSGRVGKIVAPVTSVEAVPELAEAGADELYCGVMDPAWQETFGEAALLTRRQGTAAHLASLEELEQTVRAATHAGLSVSLVLNGFYPLDCRKWFAQLLGRFADAGGGSVVAADLGLVQYITGAFPGLALHISTMAGVFNSATAKAFKARGASRIILPRDLALGEMRAAIANSPGTCFEALAMFQKCRLMDSFCSFFHDTRLYPDIPCLFRYGQDGSGRRTVAKDNPFYTGHGCMQPWMADSRPVQGLAADDFLAPRCACCSLEEMLACGVTCFKIAGRGYPSDMVTRAVRLVSAALQTAAQGSGDEARQRIRAAYADIFGIQCKPECCYYAS